MVRMTASFLPKIVKGRLRFTLRLSFCLAVVAVITCLLCTSGRAADSLAGLRSLHPEESRFGGVRQMDFKVAPDVVVRQLPRPAKFPLTEIVPYQGLYVQYRSQFGDEIS